MRTAKKVTNSGLFKVNVIMHLLYKYVTSSATSSLDIRGLSVRLVNLTVAFARIFKFEPFKKIMVHH